MKRGALWQFCTLMAHNMTPEKTDDDLMMAFQVFDRSGDGNISPDELQRIMINVGEPVTLEDVNAVIAQADEDGDGEINYEEFIKVIVHGGRSRKKADGGAADASSTQEESKAQPTGQQYDAIEASSASLVSSSPSAAAS